MKWLLIAIAVVAISLIFNLPLLAYSVAIAALVFFFTQGLTRRWTTHVSGERTCDQSTARIGDLVPVRIVVRNDGLLTITWLLAEDLLPQQQLDTARPRLSVVGTRIEVAKLKPGQSMTLNYEIRCQVRGFYQIGPSVIESGDFFGFQRRYRVIGQPNYLLVYPKVVSIEGYDIQSRRPIGEVVMSHRLFEDPTRISGVRQYQNGDPLSRIHWRATARTGELQSKQYQPSTLSGATIVLDFNRAAFDPRHEPFRSELAVTAAASIANALHEMNVQFGLVSNGVDAADRIRRTGWVGDWRTRDESRQNTALSDSSDRLQPIVVPTRKGPGQITQIIETLARVELSDGLDLISLLAETTQRMPADASVIVIVSEISLPTAVALGIVRRSGFAVTAIVNSYDLEHFARISGRLLDQGIRSHLLREEESVAWICRDQMVTR